jgi:hypothetical protein
MMLADLIGDATKVVMLWSGAQSSPLGALAQAGIGPGGDAAARGGVAAATGSGSGDAGGVIIIGVLLYSGLIIVAGLFQFFSGVLHRDKLEMNKGIKGVSGGLGCLVVGAVAIGAVVLVIKLLSGQWR